MWSTTKNIEKNLKQELIRIVNSMRNGVCPNIMTQKGGMTMVITCKDWQMGQTIMKSIGDMINPGKGYALVEEH